MLMELITEPVALPLDADDVRARLNLGDELSDDVLEAYIKAATGQIDGWDGWLGRALVQQQWRMTLEYFPCESLRIPLPPLISVDEIRYFDSTGTQQTWPDDQYRTVGQYLVPNNGVSFPAIQWRPDAIQIEFTAGYGDDGADVPEPIRQAICLTVSNLRSISAQNLFISQETVDGVGSTQYIVGGNAGAAIDAAVRSLLSTYQVFA